MKKALFVCLALCVSISLFAGGGRDSGAGTKTPLTFWTYVEQHTEFFYDAVESWNAENPNEQIELSCETYPVPEMHYTITPPGRFSSIVEAWNSIELLKNKAAHPGFLLCCHDTGLIKRTEESPVFG